MKKLLMMTLLVSGLAGVNGYAATPGYGFAGTDSNQDGEVTMEEFVAAAEIRAKKSGRPINESNLKKIFEKKDLNADGVLTKDELK